MANTVWVRGWCIAPPALACGLLLVTSAPVWAAGGAGDVWAGLIDMNRQRVRGGAAAIVNHQAICRERAGADLRELDMVGARSLARGYSEGWFEAARRRKRASGHPSRAAKAA